MKKIFVASILLIISFINSYGQWYFNKYRIGDINFLSKEQLKESLERSKRDLLFSGIIAGMGGVVFFGGGYGTRDDPTFLEQLIGDKVLNDIAKFIGTGMLVGGTIAGIVFLGRIGRIKSVIRKNFPSVGSLNITPALILNSRTRSSCPGFVLTYNF